MSQLGFCSGLKDHVGIRGGVEAQEGELTRSPQPGIGLIVVTYTVCGRVGVVDGSECDGRSIEIPIDWIFGRLDVMSYMTIILRKNEGYEQKLYHKIQAKTSNHQSPRPHPHPCTKLFAPSSVTGSRDGDHRIEV